MAAIDPEQRVPFAYTLDANGVPQPATISQWLQWSVKNPDRHKIAADEIGNSRVSTVFLTVVWMRGQHETLSFETMVFGGYYDQAQYRYATKEKALEGHGKILQFVRDGYEAIGRLMERVDGHDRRGDVLALRP